MSDYIPETKLPVLLFSAAGIMILMFLLIPDLKTALLVNAIILVGSILSFFRSQWVKKRFKIKSRMEERKRQATRNENGFIDRI